MVIFLLGCSESFLGELDSCSRGTEEGREEGRKEGKKGGRGEEGRKRDGNLDFIKRNLGNSDTM